MFSYIIIDDEEIIRKGILKKLEPLSDKITCVAEASNGHEALQLIDAFLPDIIITDMNMPNMDGIQLLSEIMAKYPGMQIIVISGYTDFEYTRQAIRASAVDYILKPFGREAIQKSVLTAIQSIEAKQTFKDQITISEAEKSAIQYDFDMQLLQGLMLGTNKEHTPFSSKQLCFLNEPHKYILFTAYSRTTLSSEQIKHHISLNDYNEFVIYVPQKGNVNLFSFLFIMDENYTVSYADFSYKYAEALISDLSTYTEKLIVGSSSHQNNIYQLNNAYHETITALNRYHVQDSYVFCPFNASTDMKETINWEKREEFLFRVETGMQQEALDLLNELFCTLTKSSYLLETVKYFCISLFDDTRLLVNNYFHQFKTNYISSNTHNLLESIFDIQEIEQYMLQFFTNITNLFRDDSVYSTNDTIAKIQKYIEKNYQKNLSLDIIAFRFYINRSYCSLRFKEKTGEKFVDYVNRIRIEKAKELLKVPEKKIFTIAKSVGYDNNKYFFRIFKKRTGMTPEQYRKSIG